MRKAFTLLELLAVIAIITLLVGIFLPAIQGVREGGRRTKCINNQKNLATAFLNYESQQGQYPGWRDLITIAHPAAPPGTEVAAHASWVFCILPQIEETGLFDRLKTGQVAVGAAAAAIPSPALMHCPSHTESAASRATCYIVNGGAVDDFTIQDPVVTTDTNVANGPFLDRAWIITGNVDPKYKHQVARSSDISKMDGTAYTLMTSENIQRGFWISEEITHFYHSPDGRLFPIPMGEYSDEILPDGRITAPLVGGMRDTAEGSIAFCWPRFYYNRTIQDPPVFSYPQDAFNNQKNPKRGFSGACDDPNSDVFSFDRQPYDSDRIPCYLNMFRKKTFTEWYHSARPSSNHPGGVVASFCDGTVRSINESISEWVFVHLMTAGAAQSDAGKRVGGNLLEGKLFDPTVLKP